MKMAAERKKSMDMDQLAVMIQAGFDNTATKNDLDKIDERLAVVEAKLDKALYTTMTQLEVKVKRLEQKAGIKQP